MGDSDSRRREFEEEVTAELRAVYALAVHLVGPGAEAEDLTQETYARAFAAWDRYALGTSARAWLLSILRSLFLRGRRDLLRHPTAELDEELPGSGEPQALPRWEQVSPQMLEQALATVPLRYREAVVLRDLQGLSYREMAFVLEVPAGTAMSRLQRGREALKRELIQRLDPDAGPAVEEPGPRRSRP